MNSIISIIIFVLIEWYLNTTNKDTTNNAENNTNNKDSISITKDTENNINTNTNTTTTTNKYFYVRMFISVFISTGIVNLFWSNKT
jgi:Mg2+/citrate symporter